MLTKDIGQKGPWYREAKNLRLFSKVKQKEFSKSCGVRPTVLSRLENEGRGGLELKLKVIENLSIMFPRIDFSWMVEEVQKQYYKKVTPNTSKELVEMSLTTETVLSLYDLLQSMKYKSKELTDLMYMIRETGCVPKFHRNLLYANYVYITISKSTRVVGFRVDYDSNQVKDEVFVMSLEGSDELHICVEFTCTGRITLDRLYQSSELRVLLYKIFDDFLNINRDHRVNMICYLTGLSSKYRKDVIDVVVNLLDG